MAKGLDLASCLWNLEGKKQGKKEGKGKENVTKAPQAKVGRIYPPLEERGGVESGSSRPLSPPPSLFSVEFILGRSGGFGSQFYMLSLAKRLEVMKENVGARKSPSLLSAFKHLTVNHSDKYISHGDSAFTLLYILEVKILRNNTYYGRSTLIFRKIPSPVF